MIALSFVEGVVSDDCKTALLCFRHFRPWWTCDEFNGAGSLIQIDSFIVLCFGIFYKKFSARFCTSR